MLNQIIFRNTLRLHITFEFKNIYEKIKPDCIEVVRKNVIIHFTQHIIIRRRAKPSEIFIQSKKIFIYN